MGTGLRAPTPCAASSRPNTRRLGRAPPIRAAAEAYDIYKVHSPEEWDPRSFASFTDTMHRFNRAMLSNGTQAAAVASATIAVEAQPAAALQDACRSLASYEENDCSNCDLLSKNLSPHSPLCCIMKADVVTVHPETCLEDALLLMATVSGLPVVRRGDGKLLGVVSRKDLSKPGTLVQDVMSRPPIAAQSHNKLQDAAALMLKYKVHRLPIVDRRQRCVGIVTRSDLFYALHAAAGGPADEAVAM